ncbi:hypothetical protein HMPREF2946_02950 [Actinomyces sp. HMSC062G12]|nr:hypothetical protein HMPREF2946_02950 [Actinomyces sp. HMSC062G12]
MAEEPHGSQTPAPKESVLRKFVTPVDTTLRTLWLLLSSLARLTVRWLSRCPATTIVTIALTICSATYWVWRDQFTTLEATPSLSHWWSIFSSIGAIPGNFIASAVLGIVTMIIAGGAAERHLGTRAWVCAALAGQVIGVTATWLTLPLLTATFSMWGKAIDGGTLWGTSLILVALAGAAGESLGSRWRWRARFLLIGVLVLSSAILGSAISYARVWALLAGILAARLIGVRGPRSDSSDDTTIRRQLASIAALCWACAAALTVVASSQEGPLAQMRWSLGPAWWLEGRTGVLTTLLCLMPIMLQVIFAYGLRKGRRAAYFGTLALQTILGLSTIASTAVALLERADSNGNLPPELFTTASFLLVPVILNLTLCVITWWMRRSFTIHAQRSTTSALLRRWATLMIGCALAVLVLGFLTSDSFVPFDVLASGDDLTVTDNASPLQIFHDYLLALLPTATASIFEPTLVPMTLFAEAPVLWIPLVAWAGTLGIMLNALLTRPRIPLSSPLEDLASLVRTHGGGTLGWMSNWDGNLVWVSPNANAGGAYRGAGGVALTVTDLAYEPGKASEAIAEFSRFAAASGLTPALYSIHEELADAAREAGWTIMQVAEESLLDLPGLAFRGKVYQDVRTAMNHATREGVEAVWTTWNDCPAGWKDQITVISDTWSADKSLPEMGFTLGGVRELAIPETRILVAIDSEHTIHAVTSWLPIYRDGQVIGLTLDVMRRRADGWRPAIEFLIGKAALAAQEEGLELLSLSGAPLARSQDDTSAFGPLTDALAAIMEPLYGFASLHAFKRKFKPRTQPLYLAVPGPTSLATVGMAIAHAYVPSVRPAQTLTLVASVTGGLAKLAARGVDDLRSARASQRQEAAAPSHPKTTRNDEATAASSANDKKEKQ